jgi:aspartate/methionine/tyrosine aminotransferase
MEVGQPGFAAPQGVREAAARALENPTIWATPRALGYLALRRADCGPLHVRSYGIDIDPATDRGDHRVVGRASSSRSWPCSMPGKGVLLPVPTYPAYRNILTAMDLRAEMLHLPDGTVSACRMRRTSPMQAAAADPGVKGLLIASPANPTGTIIGAEALAGPRRAVPRTPGCG